MGRRVLCHLNAVEAWELMYQVDPIRIRYWMKSGFNVCASPLVTHFSGAFALGEVFVVGIRKHNVPVSTTFALCPFTMREPTAMLVALPLPTGSELGTLLITCRWLGAVSFLKVAASPLARLVTARVATLPGPSGALAAVPELHPERVKTQITARKAARTARNFICEALHT
jgi:hypothetical protein